MIIDMHRQIYIQAHSQINIQIDRHNVMFINAYRQILKGIIKSDNTFSIKE